MTKKTVLSLLLALSVLPALAQVQAGLYPYGSFDSPGPDTIDRGSLNVHLVIPVVTKQGRALPFQYQLVYDSLVWTPMGSVGSQTWMPAVGFGLHGQLNEGLQGYLSYDGHSIVCGTSYSVMLNNYVYHDPFGVSHPFTYVDNLCTHTSTGGGPSPDGSQYSYSGANVTTPDGKQINPPVNSQTGSGSTTDTNGNYLSNNGDGTFTDTLGKTALTITGSGTPSSPRIFQYSTPTGNATVTVTYETYTVQTAFGCTVGVYDLPQDLVNTITLADGSVYQFNYEATPGNPSTVTGRLAKLTLPQGGAISYEYTGANNGIVCADGTPTGLTRTTADGIRTYVRSAITTTSSHTDLVDGLNNDSGFDFVMAGSPEAFYETNRTIHENTTGNPVLLSRQTCYNGAANPCTTTPITLPVAQIDTYETLGNNEEHGSTLTYNSYGLQTSETDYDFGSSTRGSALRKETWTYPTTGLVGLLISDSVADGSSNPISLTSYLYDETMGPGHGTLVGTTGLLQHLPESGQRGNLTTLTQSYSPGHSLVTDAQYEDTGNALNVTGPTGESVYAYDAATHAFTVTATPPTPSSGISLPSSATYDPNSSLPLTAVDPNSQTVTYETYDPLFRPTEIVYPDGGIMIASYTPTSTGVYHYMNASTHTNTQTSLDALGRLSWVAVQNGSGGYYWNNYCYGGNGDLQYASYTFSSGGLVCSGSGGDNYTSDALHRVLTITHGDSSTVNYGYNGRATQVTDENGVSRIVQVDGLGRPTAICEIVASGTPGSAACGLDITANGFKTTYVYTTDTTAGNALKTAVTQGAQTRTFETDWLGRTTSVIQPEVGTTTYSYGYSTTAGYGLTVTRVRPQANQTGTTLTTTTTQYDSIGRVLSVNYSDTLTPNKQFFYDVNSYWTPSATNLKGRLAVMGAGADLAAHHTGSLFSYDAMGRVVGMWACAPATCGTGYQTARPLSFAYDWAGNLTQESDNVSGTINYGRSIAGEVTSITNSTYTGLPYNPPNLVSSVVNGPDGPVSYTLGNGLNVYRSYDTLGRLYGQWVCNGPAAQNCTGGTEVYGTAGQWKGSQLQLLSDTVLGQHITYGYDGLNRLTSRTVTFGTVQNYTYTYDQYGNRLTQTPLQGGYTFDPTINSANNRITTSGFTYDAAGNMMNDTVHGYTYDAEGNILQVDGGSTAVYVYDALNQRVHVQTASATNEFVYDYAGRRISTWLSPNNHGNEGQIYWGGQQIGFRSTDGTTYFDHQDTLGTERMRTNYGGTAGSSYTSLPWGDAYTATVNNSGADQDNLHFAGLQHDAESDTEHAQFRNYASAQGRWLAPDPYMGSYDFSNPQSFNRYAYALNNPASFIDPSGLHNPTGVGSSCANDPVCATGYGGNSGGGGGGCSGYDASCGGGGGIGFDPFFGSFCCGMLGGLAGQEESQWLGSGSIPYYSVQGGELMFLVADPWSQILNQSDFTFSQIPTWLDLGSASNGVASGTYSYFGGVPGSGGGGGGGRGSSTSSWSKKNWDCVANVGWPVIQDDLNPLSFGIGSFADAASQMSQASLQAAAAWSVQRGLTVPLRSSIVRAGVSNAEALGEASGLLTLVGIEFALGDAVYAEQTGCKF